MLPAVRPGNETRDAVECNNFRTKSGNGSIMEVCYLLNSELLGISAASVACRDGRESSTRES
jgi:hypothetical protein